MISDPNIPKKRREFFAKVIRDSSQKLLSIVNDILDISKIETGQMVILKKTIFGQRFTSGTGIILQAQIK